MEERVRVAGIIPIQKGFAFMHRKNVQFRPIHDYYTFPGGGREGNESLEDGVKREIKEEFGIDVEVVELLYEWENSNDERSKKEYVFLCKYLGGEFGTGNGPEFSNDPKYADRGQYVPEIVSREDVKNINLLPPNIKEKFVNDLEKGKL